jgi:hypothetical protein
MLTADGPSVLEYNTRFGDPETQVVLPRIESDVLALLWAASSGTLSQFRLLVRPESAVCVVIAAKGYPDLPRRHRRRTPPASVTANGGRVLGVTALAPTLREAATRAYAACDQVQWASKYYRRDIGAKQLNRSCMNRSRLCSPLGLTALGPRCTGLPAASAKSAPTLRSDGSLIADSAAPAACPGRRPRLPQARWSSTCARHTPASITAVDTARRLCCTLCSLGRPATTTRAGPVSQELQGRRSTGSAGRLPASSSGVRPGTRTTGARRLDAGSARPLTRRLEKPLRRAALVRDHPAAAAPPPSDSRRAPKTPARRQPLPDPVTCLQRAVHLHGALLALKPASVLIPVRHVPLSARIPLSPLVLPSLQP